MGNTWMHIGDMCRGHGSGNSRSNSRSNIIIGGQRHEKNHRHIRPHK